MEWVRNYAGRLLRQSMTDRLARDRHDQGSKGGWWGATSSSLARPTGITRIRRTRRQAHRLPGRLAVTGTPERIVVAMGAAASRWSREPARRSRPRPSRAARGQDRPRVCFLATASGDCPSYIANFYAAFARRPRPATFHCSRTLDTSRASCSTRTSSTSAATPRTCSRSGLASTGRPRRSEGVGVRVARDRAVGRIAVLVRDRDDRSRSGPPRALSVVSGSCRSRHRALRRRGEPAPVYHRLVAEGRSGGYAADDGAALVFRTD